MSVQLIPLLLLSYTLYEECYGLSIVYKLFVIKVSVGFVAIQGFAMDILFSSGFLNVPDDYSFSTFDQKSKVQRAYCLLCLSEFLLLCIPLYLGFALPLKPSQYYLEYRNSLAESADFNHENEKVMMFQYSRMSESLLSNGDELSKVLNYNPVGIFQLVEDVFNIYKFPCDDFLNLDRECFKRERELVLADDSTSLVVS